MDKYEVELHGVKVKLSVVDHATLIDEKIAELTAALDTARPVMGLDIKTTLSTYNSAITKASVLLLCSEGHCLIIPKLHTLPMYYGTRNRFISASTQLGRLLGDLTVCFLGKELKEKKNLCEEELRSLMSNEGVEVGHFAARIVKKPDLEAAELPKLAAEVGLDVKPLTGTCPGWDARVFSQEGIKHARFMMFILPTLLGRSSWLND